MKKDNLKKENKQPLFLDFVQLNKDYNLIKNKKGQIFFIDKTLCFKDLKQKGVDFKKFKDCQIFENFFDAKDKNEDFEHAIYLDYNFSNGTYLCYTYHHILHPIPKEKLQDLMEYFNFKDVQSFCENYKI